jgi:hypothetical protein
MVWEGVTAIVGELGSGKTLVLTLLGYKAYKLGYKVFSNYWVAFPHVKVINPLDIEKIREGIFLADELWVWVDSRLSGSEQNQFLSKILLKTRKKKIILMYTAQNLSQIDLRIRNITNWYIFPIYDIYTKYCKYYVTDIAGNVILKRKFYAPPLFKIYNSYNGLYEEEEKEEEDFLEILRQDTILGKLRTKKAKIGYLKKKYKLKEDIAYFYLELLS